MGETYGERVATGRSKNKQFYTTKSKTVCLLESDCPNTSLFHSLSSSELFGSHFAELFFEENPCPNDGWPQCLTNHGAVSLA